MVGGSSVSPSSARRAARHNGAALGACASGAGPVWGHWGRGSGQKWVVSSSNELEFHRILLTGTVIFRGFINTMRVWFLVLDGKMVVSCRAFWIFQVKSRDREWWRWFYQRLSEFWISPIFERLRNLTARCMFFVKAMGIQFLQA